MNEWGMFLWGALVVLGFMSSAAIEGSHETLAGVFCGISVVASGVAFIMFCVDFVSYGERVWGW